MRGFGFALFLFCMNLMVGVLGTIAPMIGLVSAGHDSLTSHITEADIINTVNASGTGIGFVDTAFNTVDLVGKASSLFLKFVYNTTIGLAPMLMDAPFNIPYAIVIGLILPLQLLMFAVMIAEFFRGTSVEA